MNSAIPPRIVEVRPTTEQGHMSLSGFGALIETNEETNVTTTRIAMATMNAVQISKPGGEFEIVERENS